MLAASHSHSGPDYLGYWEPVDPSIATFMEEMVLSAIGQALATRRPARMGIGKGSLGDTVINRRDAAHSVDPDVCVLRIDSENGQPMAVLFVYACHPIVAGSSNRLISAEFPGRAASCVEELLGPGVVAVYLNGAAGNINPVAFPYSSRENVSVKSRQQAMAGEQITCRSLDDAMRLGSVLGGEVLRVASMVSTSHQATVATKRTAVRLAVKDPDEMARFLLHVAHSPAAEASLRAAHWLESEVMAVRIGDLILIGFPGEPFVEIGLRLQQRGRAPQVVRVVGYANDYPGYVLPLEEYDANRYENVATPLAREGAQALIEAAEGVLVDALGP